MRSFVYSAQPPRVVFGAGSAGDVRAELSRLDRHRVLLLTGPGRHGAAPVADALGERRVAEFNGAAQHTPVEVTERALAVLREHEVDCVVAVGGGSTTGLAKALAVRTGVAQIILPTTYAGSEVTPVLGETENGVKTTRTDDGALPDTVVYDVDLTLGLPVAASVASAVNALAHAAEALYARSPNPATDALALAAIRDIADALPTVAADPSDVAARAGLLRGAWLAGRCLATVEMGLHHKLCHTLGGSFGLPHAQTHAVLLPHALAYNAPAAPDALRRIADALGTDDAPSGLFDLVVGLGGPASLRELGLAEADVERAARLAGARRYPNPREVTVEGMTELLRAAWRGDRPVGPRPVRAETSRITGQVVASLAGTSDARLRRLVTDLVRRLHGFAVDNDLTETEWRAAIDFLTRTGGISDDRRQEVVLLSDVLGVSSVVDVLANSRTPDTTPSAVLGPFYVAGQPVTEQGVDISGGLPGTPLWVDVRVTDESGGAVADAAVDVWQSNEDGWYDVQLPDADGPVLRARFRSDGEGRVRFWSILPSEYPVPVDGPVGELLTAAGRHPYRAPHLHFLIEAPGHRRLVTQLFVRGGRYLDSDAVFGVKPALVVDFREGAGAAPGGRPVAGGWRVLEYTFRIAPS